MIKYYHNWLTCPHCHNPHVEQSLPKGAIKGTADRLMLCNNCNCLFSPEVEFENNGNRSSLPLFWEIVPNPIEKTYMDWLKNPPTGLFLIIWPWQEVKTTCLIVHELLKVDCNHRPIAVFSPNVVTDMDATHDYCMQSPSPNILWKCLFEFDVKSSEELKGPQQKALYKIVDGISKLHKTRELRYRTALGSGTIHSNAFRKDPQEIIPPGSSLIPDGDNVVPRRFDILYTKGWFAEVADALSKEDNQIDYLKHHAPNPFHIVTRFQDLEDLPADREVIFIKTKSRGLDAISPSADLIRDRISNPRAVIIEDVESLLHSFRREDFFAFLKELPSDCLVLMFSINKSLRYLHEELRQKFPNMTTHCWDTEKRLESLRTMMAQETKYPPPGSSRLSELKRGGAGGAVQTELIDVEELTGIFTEIDEEISKSVERGVDRRYLREAARYLSHVRRTVLPLNSRFHGFSRWSSYKNDSINFYEFVRNLQIDEGALVEKVKRLGSICEEEHPSFQQLLCLIDKFGTEKTIIAVHAEDASKLRNLLVDRIGKELIVVDWARYSRIIRNLAGRHSLIIIDPPYDGDLLSLENIGRVIILGDRENNHKVKKIIDMMVDSKMGPIFLRPGEAAPRLLIELEERLKDIEVEINREKPLDEAKITTKISWEDVLKEKEAYGGREGDGGGKQAPSEVVVFSNIDGYSVAFPPHSNIAWRGTSGSGLNTALEIYEKSIRSCSILLSRHEKPLKVRLADWLINEAPNNSHRKGKFIWPSYEDMILDSIEWVERLKQKASAIGDDKLANRIRAAGTAAQDEDYIKRWWKVSETPAINTSHGPILIPSVEHPSRLKDLIIIANVIGDEQLNQQSEKIYHAALEIQRIRNLVINLARESSVGGESSQENEPELDSLINEFKKDFLFFEVSNIQVVPYNDKIPLYRVLKLSGNGALGNGPT